MPTNWKEESIGKLISLDYGKTLTESERSNGCFPVYGSNGIVGWHNSSIVSGPGIIVGRKGSVGEICWSNNDFWPIDTTYYVQKKQPVDWRWCYWQLQTLNLKRLDSSTGVPGLNRNDVYEIVIKIPPFSEQNTIASILDKVDDSIRQTEAVIEKIKKIKVGLLHDLLTCGIDENGELRDPIRHPEQFKDSPLGKVPNNPSISTVSLDMIVDLVMQKISGNKNPEVPYIGLENLPTNGGKLLGSSPASTSVSINNVFKNGDILFGKLRPRLKKSIQINFEGYCSTDILVLRPTPNFYSRYIGIIACSEFVFNEAIRTEEGTKMPRTSWNAIKKVELLCPAIDEQITIASIFDKIDEDIDQTEISLSKLKLIKQGLMQDLLSGRVRVE